MITILETIKFKWVPGSPVGYHIGQKDNVLYYGEEYSQIMWMKADEFMSKNISTDINREKIVSLIKKYERDLGLKKLGI